MVSLEIFVNKKALGSVFILYFFNLNLDRQSPLNYHQNIDYKILAKFEFFGYTHMMQKKNFMSSPLEIHLYLSFNDHEGFCS